MDKVVLMGRLTRDPGKNAAGNGTGGAIRTDAAAGDGFTSIPNGIDEELPFN